MRPRTFGEVGSQLRTWTISLFLREKTLAAPVSCNVPFGVESSIWYIWIHAGVKRDDKVRQWCETNEAVTDNTKLFIYRYVEMAAWLPFLAYNLGPTNHSDLGRFAPYRNKGVKIAWGCAHLTEFVSRNGQLSQTEIREAVTWGMR